MATKKTKPAPNRRRGSKTTTANSTIAATPSAAKLAKANRLDLADLVGSGTGGRIILRDVQAVIAADGEEPVVIERGGPPTAGNGYVLISVFGPFNSVALLETSAERATELLGMPLSSTLGPTRVVDAVGAEISLLEQRKPGLAESTFAATAIALAYELDNPFNSATSKSMCSRSLAEVVDRLRALAPEPDEGTPLDAIRRRLAESEAEAAKKK